MAVDGVRGCVVSIHAPARGATSAGVSAAAAARCFNPRPRAGGDRAGQPACRCSRGFNPRPRAGGDLRRRGRGVPPGCFNPRPRAGGDRACERGPCRGVRVSIHAPARGATCASVSTTACRSRFQSTPPRGGRHLLRVLYRATEHVSIHAPARGATTRPATEVGPIVFQSTPPRGGRLRLPDGHRERHRPPCFNPRPRAGGDLRSRRSLRPLSLFQSTPPRGGRRATAAPPMCRASFNPRPRAGGDTCKSPSPGASMVFQSTPPRGGRRHQQSEAQHVGLVSIHAPARGATWNSIPSRSPRRFNPRPRAGGDSRRDIASIQS